MSEFLYLDCETIPTQDPHIIAGVLDDHAPDLDTIVADGRLTDPAKIAADIAKKRDAAVAKGIADGDKAYRKLCFHGATAHIACVSFALGDDEVEGFLNWSLEDFDGRHNVPDLARVEAGERRMLTSFFAALRLRLHEIAREAAEADWEQMAAASDRDGFRDIGGGYVQKLPTEGRDAWIKGQTMRRAAYTPIVVAHYAMFDVRMLWQRAKILGVPVPVWWPIDAHKYRSDQVVDTMTLWAGHDDRVSLDTLCRALKIPGKDGMDGSKVWDAIQAGNAKDVWIYCDEDVERVRRVHKHLTAEPEEKQSFELLHIGKAWTDTERAEMLAAAEEAADAQHGVASEEVA